MPELPEVETIRRGLEQFIQGQTIQRIEILCDKSFQGPTEVVIGQRIIDLRRRGKALLIDLENEVTLMIHLRMTGQLIYRPIGITDGQDLTKTFAGGHPTDSFYQSLPDRQTRVIFHLENGTLFFNDQRKFGFVKPLPTSEVEQDKFIASLGKEPWDISADEFYNKLQRRKNSPIKAVILDQKIIAGIGNIYADEALFMTGIHPATPAGLLTKRQASELIKNSAKIMDASIDSGGSTMATYIRPDGSKGSYLEKFAQVFRREGTPCPRCGTEIIKLRVAGRGTHICPHCQRILSPHQGINDASRPDEDNSKSHKSLQGAQK